MVPIDSCSLNVEREDAQSLNTPILRSHGTIQKAIRFYSPIVAKFPTEELVHPDIDLPNAGNSCGIACYPVRIRRRTKLRSKIQAPQSSPLGGLNDGYPKFLESVEPERVYLIAGIVDLRPLIIADYDTKNVELEFPFGHGLSYTDFSSGPIPLSKTPEGLVAKLLVKNTG
jgi:hypothetical protein